MSSHCWDLLKEILNAILTRETHEHEDTESKKAKFIQSTRTPLLPLFSQVYAQMNSSHYNLDMKICRELLIYQKDAWKVIMSEYRAFVKSTLDHWIMLIRHSVSFLAYKFDFDNTMDSFTDIYALTIQNVEYFITDMLIWLDEETVPLRKLFSSVCNDLLKPISIILSRKSTINSIQISGDFLERFLQRSLFDTTFILDYDSLILNLHTADTTGRKKEVNETSRTILAYQRLLFSSLELLLAELDPFIIGNCMKVLVCIYIKAFKDKIQADASIVQLSTSKTIGQDVVDHRNIEFQLIVEFSSMLNNLNNASIKNVHARQAKTQLLGIIAEYDLYRRGADFLAKHRAVFLENSLTEVLKSSTIIESNQGDMAFKDAVNRISIMIKIDPIFLFNHFHDVLTYLSPMESSTFCDVASLNLSKEIIAISEKAYKIDFFIRLLCELVRSRGLKETNNAFIFADQHFLKE